MATELAKAYVQIIPSAKGIKGSLTNAIGGEANSAGAATGQSFGGKMMGALKGIIVAAGIGKALSMAITEGAALEQSIGGIETLFKNSAEKVKQNAANAYRTAGMSANEYMELTTSFSASLLQSLAGDTAAAADVADMAMTDMSDNANKMGTSMEDIKNAYQGFAKQNYTMLDNLKLGYGGTKTEMERLLADAEKITGVKYDIGNLSDVYSAIHVIQGELDITGTTAKEAASTLSGSLASMSAAFKNVLGQLTLGQDIGPALSALAQTVTTFLVGNLIPAVWNILRALPGAAVTLIQTAVPQLVNAFLQFLPQLQADLTAGGPQLLQKGTELLNQLVNGVFEALPYIFKAAYSAIAEFGNGILANLPEVLEAGKNVLMNVVSGLQQALPEIWSAAASMIASLLSGLVTNLPQILSAGFDLVVSLISGIGNALPSLGTAAGQAARKIWDAIKRIDWLQLGKEIVRGLINGIGAMAGALWDAAVNIAKSALNAIKSFFGIASPSKVMRDQVGRFIPAGLALGIEGNTRPVTNAMHDLTDLTSGKIQTDLAVELSKSSAGRQVEMQSRDNSVRSGSVINVYGAPGQDVRQLAKLVMTELQSEIDRKEARFR